MNHNLRKVTLTIANAVPWWLYLFAGIIGTIGMLAIVYHHGPG